MFGVKMAAWGHHETSAHPNVEWTRFRGVCPLWGRDGLVGTKTQFACGTGPEGYGVAVTDVYSELATAGLTQRGAPQVFRRRVRKHPQPLNPPPMRQRQESTRLTSNRSTMESMIDSKEAHVFDTEV